MFNKKVAKRNESTIHSSTNELTGYDANYSFIFTELIAEHFNCRYSLNVLTN